MPRPGLRSKAQKRHKVRTPGNQNTTHYWRKKPKYGHCAICKRPLQGIPRLRPAELKKTTKVSRRASRMESGRYCTQCLKALIKEAARSE